MTSDAGHLSSQPTQPAKLGLVLCVDDEPHIVRALQWLLQKQFDVLTASSARDALELCRANDVDVVISDQRMPEMPGVDFLREVRTLRPRAMRILMTGYSDMSAMLRSVNESEVFRFITKPWSVTELPKVIAQAAEISRTRPVVVDPVASDDDPPAERDSACVLVIEEDPDVHRWVLDTIGAEVRTAHVANLADAIHWIQEAQPAVIVSELKVGGFDATRLIRLMKQRHPSTVSIMISRESDADTVAALINQGQIYRFVTKPIKAGYFKLVVRSALARHRQIAATPGLSARYQVEMPKKPIENTLVADVARAAKATAARRGDDSILGRVSIAFRNLFG